MVNPADLIETKTQATRPAFEVLERFGETLPKK